eukprot:gnl/Chilomastix_cuspidata/7758.p1 GENE.gnl/Chilomastix_cuspidata/7758~~gnl/Chilomastix_cuspidata/7758.p1  ORF type:complete len:140 (+),score=9.44 gnl/Chilomastix_cuspidata/7758:175-594(+)
MNPHARSRRHAFTSGSRLRAQSTRRRGAARSPAATRGPGTAGATRRTQTRPRPRAGRALTRSCDQADQLGRAVAQHRRVRVALAGGPMPFTGTLMPAMQLGACRHACPPRRLPLSLVLSCSIARGAVPVLGLFIAPSIE